jgi:hypothetical protein
LTSRLKPTSNDDSKTLNMLCRQISDSCHIMQRELRDTKAQ